MKGRTRGTETSKYPEEKKSKEIPKVAASELGVAVTIYMNKKWNSMERLDAEGDIPVHEIIYRN